MKRPYGELFILEVLKSKSYTTKQIADKFNLFPASVSRVLKKLQREGELIQFTKNNLVEKYYKLNKNDRSKDK